ncbi:hypothetical protein [Encephalitozoon cuniculi GB-M1]|uniref:SCP domain-containing protein n=1 Tax=Encephalitozoon cuniculi (strain GB-M1) TaxID=284813 RepID=Q8SW30_ENCCU|nr:uncharacterized protein ECU03_0990 [Encephalitozoon cuniculi GB-M1]CAD26243.1 hypothetical protein [Encephalitozoon cuniculi GB-M1]
MISAWLFLGCVFCSLESDMLKYTNKFRSEHNMEELYNLPSLQKAADMQVLYMCRKSKLTHDGASGEGFTLAGRLKRFDFVGLNIGENIAKQENDDYKEVVKLWMKSTEHRNNILGDYVYSGVATCVGKDGNRYWVQVFGKDVSNTRIAKMRDGMKLLGSGGCGTEGSDMDRSGGRRKMCGEKSGFGKGDYIMVVPPPGYEGELEGAPEPSREVEDGQEENDGSITDRAGGGDYPSKEIRRTPGGGLDRRKYPGWSSTRKPKPFPRGRDRRREERELLSFGDYLIPPQSQGKEPPRANAQTSTYSASIQEVFSTAADSIKAQTSTAPILTFVFKNPGNSTIIPALQSLIEVIKGTLSQDRSSSSTSAMSSASYTSSKTDALHSTQASASSNVQASSETSSKGPISTVTVTRTTHKLITTVYLSKYQVSTTTVPSDRKDSSQPLRSGKDSPGQRGETTPERRAVSNRGVGNEDISSVVRLDGLYGVREGEDNGKGSVHEHEGKCQNGYNRDGSCAVSKELDSAKLKDALEDLVRKGKVHLHIISDESCADKDGCYEKSNRVDIGIPFSYKL